MNKNRPQILQHMVIDTLRVFIYTHTNPMKQLKYVCLITIFAIAFRTNAQSRINVKAADSLDFILTINDVIVNNSPCISITLDKLPAGKINVRATIPSRPELKIEQVLTLKKNSSAFYEIEKSKGVFKFVLKSESTLQIASPLTEQLPSDAPIEDPAPVDSVEIVSSGGCNNVVDEEVYESMLREVTDNFFETRKLDVMKNFLVHHCVRVEQLRYMMSRLSLEDNKYELLKTGISQIHDPANLKRVQDDFFLEKNRARVDALIAR